MKYADRARKITNKPIINMDSSSQIIESLRKQVTQLQVELARMKGVDVSELDVSTTATTTATTSAVTTANLVRFTFRSYNINNIF